MNTEFSMNDSSIILDLMKYGAGIFVYQFCKHKHKENFVHLCLLSGIITVPHLGLL